MSWLLWTVVGWVAVSVLVVPVVVRLCRCVARFDASPEQWAAAASGAEASLAFAAPLVERRSGVDRRNGAQSAPRRRLADVSAPVGLTH